MDFKNGLLRSSFFNGAKVTPSSVWNDPNVIQYNKVENLLDFNSCEGCRWWSQSIPNSNVIFIFNQKIIINAYLLQSVGYIYPKSWNVYYTIDDDENWKLLDYQQENTYLSNEIITKKFPVKPTLMKKFKIFY